MPKNFEFEKFWEYSQKILYLCRKCKIWTTATLNIQINSLLQQQLWKIWNKCDWLAKLWSYTNSFKISFSKSVQVKKTWQPLVHDSLKIAVKVWSKARYSMQACQAALHPLTVWCHRLVQPISTKSRWNKVWTHGPWHGGIFLVIKGIKIVPVSRN